MGTISLDGTKVHADASKSHAVSYKRLREQEQQLRAEAEALFALSEQADHAAPPDGLVLDHEIALRQERLARQAEANTVLEARAAERDAQEAAEYAAKVQAREERARRKGRKPGGRPPTSPTPGPRDKDQYNFTDPESRIMKNSTDQGYNAQVAVDQASMLIVGLSLSNHLTDQEEVAPTLDAMAPALGRPRGAALDAGYFSAANIALLEARGIEPYIAPGRDGEQHALATRLVPLPTPPANDARPKLKMAYKLKTALGAAIYRARKSTVEPVIGIIKDAMGFRQFSLRRAQAAAGEWCLVCLAFNLRRFHTLLQG